MSEIQVKNLMEELVNDRIDNLMELENICHCPRCRADVYALALNHLPPKYIASASGDMFARVQAVKGQFQVDITTAILRAIAVVGPQPSHGEENK